MRALIGRWLPIAAALAAGLLVLGGYFLPSAGVLVEARALLLDWAVVVAGFALLLGLANIVRVHGRRIVDQEQGWPHSLALLVAALLAWIPGVLPIDAVKDGVFHYVLGPLGSAVAALLLFALVLAAVRMMRVRQGVEVPVFLLVAGLVLLGSTPLAGSGWFAGFRDWLIRVPGTAGTRGLLLGVALGTVIAGLRVIFGSERPHAEDSVEPKRRRRVLKGLLPARSEKDGQVDG